MGLTGKAGHPPQPHSTCARWPTPPRPPKWRATSASCRPPLSRRPARRAIKFEGEMLDPPISARPCRCCWRGMPCVPCRKR